MPVLTALSINVNTLDGFTPSEKDRGYLDGSKPNTFQVNIIGPYTINAHTYQPLIVPTTALDTVPYSATTVLASGAYITLRDLNLQIIHDAAESKDYRISITMGPASNKSLKILYKQDFWLKQGQQYKTTLPDIEKFFVPENYNVYIHLDHNTMTPSNVTFNFHATVIADDK